MDFLKKLLIADFDIKDSGNRDHAHFLTSWFLVNCELGTVFIKATIMKSRCSADQAKTIEGWINQYHRTLVEHGVNTPTLIKTGVLTDAAQTILVDVSAYGGQNVCGILPGDEYTSRAILGGIVRSMGTLLFCQQPLAGLDFRHDNFLLAEDGVVRYCDNFPPRIQLDAVALVDWPQPPDSDTIAYLYQRYYFLPRVLHRLVFKFEQEFPGLEKVLLDEAKRIIPTTWWQQITGFLSTTPRALFDKKEIRSVRSWVQTMVIPQFDLARELFFRLTAPGERNLELVNLDMGLTPEQRAANFASLKLFLLERLG